MCLLDDQKIYFLLQTKACSTENRSPKSVVIKPFNICGNLVAKSQYAHNSSGVKVNFSGAEMKIS